MTLLARTGLAAALVLGSAATARPAPELPRPDDGYFQETVKVAPGVWLLMEPKFVPQPIGNVTVIEQADGLVLIDAGGSPGSARRIVHAIKGLSPKPVKAVVITHWHGDHPQGLSEVLKVWPRARTIATRATQAHLRTDSTMNTPAAPDMAANAAFQKRIQDFLPYVRRMGAEAKTPGEKAGWAATERLLHQYARDMDGAVTLPVSEGFEDRLDLPDAKAPVEIHFLGRANTDGDAVAWLPKQKILITGDIVVAPIPFGFGGYPADWIETLGKVEAYDFKVLIPGHGAPQRDRAYVGKVRAALTDVRAQVAPLAASGLALKDVQAKVDVERQARPFVGDDPWLRRWFVDDWLSPIVASAYKEAKGQPIVQSLRGE
ncbi:MBL fold metallo-hydrolase [Phenylobacterium sp.]|uniref:MBL fold metallo-hydrolase n=1 Tax=Phenylobacterium sp. TaxID=1871053 RepID=UPI0025FABB51|nr:MBL fold metallo-hydrolase [Phenylobacterium sp.]MBX3484782.1 MBL fold metallo-hydrolase [Phenylobacterium sp.]MCW5758610.1 MBL fold metallo-hydrolase [Phenylobacterium sp.]